VLKEFVSAYNTLRTPLNQATAAAANSSSSSGALAGDAGARDMLNQLARLTTTPLATSGSIRTLSDMGISTNRDGTLKLDEARFDKAYAADPNGIAQLISPSVSSASTPGLAKIVTDVQTKLESDTGSLKSSKASYEKLAAQLTKQLEKLDTQMTDYEAQLNKTYTAMQTRLSSLKATNSYMTQQIAAWNNSDN
jgi:flagellar hook-associated protein 2